MFSPQVREPGEAVQVDWTHADEFGVMIRGQGYAHRLCHAVLPYSNMEWVIPCASGSLLSLKAGLQAALWEFGGVPLQARDAHRSRRRSRQRAVCPRTGQL